MCWLFVTIAYICYISCVAEVSSIISFPGGSYGYVRCTVGPLIGYIVGLSEILQFMFHVANTMLFFIFTLETIFETNANNNERAVYIMICFIILLSSQMFGRKFMWYWVSFWSLISIGVFFMYLFVNIKHLNFRQYAYPSASSTAASTMNMTMYDFMARFPFALRFYLGLDIIQLTCEEVRESRKNVPRALLSSLATQVLGSLWYILTVVSQPPGVQFFSIVALSAFPFLPGLTSGLKVLSRFALIFFVPLIIGSGSNFVYTMGMQASSMARSGLLPSIFQCQSFTEALHHIRLGTNGNNANVKVQPTESDEDGVPIVAMFIGCSFAVMIAFCAIYFNNLQALYDMCVLGATVVYMCMCCTYLVFKSRFSNLPRTFTSPFGRVGAVIAALCFLLTFISVLGFSQSNNTDILISYFGFMVLMTAYYYIVAEPRQYFSEIEQKKFMKAYILNANNRKKKSGFQRMMDDVRRVLSVKYLLGTVQSFFRGTRNNNSSDADSVASSNHGQSSVASAGSPRKAAKHHSAFPTSPTMSSVVTMTSTPRKSLLATVMGMSGSTSTVDIGGNNKVAPLSMNPPIMNPPLQALDSDDPEIGAVSAKNRNTGNPFMNTSVRLNYSGKVMDMRKSQELFQLLHRDPAPPTTADAVNDDEHEGEGDEEGVGKLAQILVEKLPEHFAVVRTIASVRFGGIDLEQSYNTSNSKARSVEAAARNDSVFLNNAGYELDGKEVEDTGEELRVPIGTLPLLQV